MAELPNRETHISKRELDFGYWLATHRQLLHRILISVLGIIAAASIGLFLYTTVIWVTHIQQTDDILSALSLPDVNYQAIRRPEELVVRSARAVIRDDHSIDIVAHLQNPNDIWAAVEITYEMTVAGATTGIATTALAPSEEKYITKQSIPFSGAEAPAIRVEIHDVQWKKFVDTSNLPTTEWIFSNAHYAYVQSAAEDIPLRTELTFTIQNKSVYGFREAQVVVLLHDDNGDIHGIGSVTLDEIVTEESRSLTFRWPLRLPTGLQPTIYVNIDQLTENRIIRSRQ